eukprot:TRINITY_DN25728_c0_g1_i1.p1 TRINITY_DN25728_c0_g1~~TRINITY_DN25728_c0_g1_i1.p1  ORF type:complete len:861 (+),score=281.12 TRINITY_DN25728_c0_g1_i1:64-2646(+)
MNPLSAAQDVHNMSLPNVDPFETSPARPGTEPTAAPDADATPARLQAIQRSATQSATVSFAETAEVVQVEAGSYVEEATPSHPATQAAADGHLSPKTPTSVRSQRTTIAAAVTPRRTAETQGKMRTPCRLGSEAQSVLQEGHGTSLAGGSWLSRMAEDVAFTASYRVYALFLLLSNLLFVVLLGVRLLASVWVHTFIAREVAVWEVASGLLSFALLLTFFSSVVDLDVRLIRSWAKLTRETVHVFYLPNADYTRQAIHTRNLYLAVLLVATVAVPFVAAVVHCCLDGSAFPFVGVFAFYGFGATNFVVACVYLYMSWMSVVHKRRVWKDAAAQRDELAECDDEDDVAWQKRVIANPLAMAEFGCDLLTVRSLALQVCALTIWAMVMVSVFDVMPDGQLWMIFVVAILLGSVSLALSLAKPGSKATNTARRQRRVAILCMIVAAALCVLGVIGALVLRRYATLAAHLVLLALTQGLAARRHDLHVNDEMVLAEDDEEDDDLPVTRWLAVLPCQGLLQACLPKHPCFGSTSRKEKARREQELSMVAEHHCAALEEKLDGTQRVLTADAKISVSFLIATAVVMFVGAHFGGQVNDVFPAAGANITVIETPPSVPPYPACALTWHGVPSVDLALLTYVAKRTLLSQEVLTKDTTDLLGAAWNVTHVEDRADDHAASWVHYKHTASGTSVVAAARGESPKAWAHDADVWGDDALLAVFAATNPFVGVWEPAHKEGFVRTLAGIAAAFGTDPGRYTEPLAAYLAPMREGGRVVLTGHAMPGGYVLQKDLGVPTVAFGAPGTARADSTQEGQANIAADGALLSLLEGFGGFAQRVGCGKGATGCQEMKAVVCELLIACRGAKLDVCV